MAELVRILRRTCVDRALACQFNALEAQPQQHVAAGGQGRVCEDQRGSDAVAVAVTVSPTGTGKTSPSRPTAPLGRISSQSALSER